MKLSTLAFATMALLAPAGAQAGTFIASFDGTCINGGSTKQAACTSVAGTSASVVTGGTPSLKLTSTNDISLQVVISAWQSNQATNVITAANWGAYSGGLGITGAGDNNGNNNLHTMDNIGGYTDFFVLQFSRAVELTSVKTTPFELTLPNGSKSTDSDLSYFNANGVIVPSVWSTPVNISGAQNDPSRWTTLSPDVGSSTATRNFNISNPDQFSTVWLVSASQLTSDRGDGFKLAQLFVQPQIPPIPEPATWAMMIVGFGVIGATLRRRPTVAARFA